MPKRKIPLVEGEIYHILSKSIAGFEIFRNKPEYKRGVNLLRYYTIETLPLKFSIFMQLKGEAKLYQKDFAAKERSVEIIAYCLMPTHIHLILKQLKENGISTFTQKVFNSYARYFNLKTKRKGPLWESRFKNIRAKTNEQLLHLTRYIHLNPVTAHLVNKPQDWAFSSYKEFLGKLGKEKQICNYSTVLDIKPDKYKQFVNCQIDYQRELAEVKKLFLE